MINSILEPISVCRKIEAKKTRRLSSLQYQFRDLTAATVTCFKQPINKWQSDLEIDTEDWKACVSSQLLTTDAKFTWFQYTINQNTLNRFLAKINIKNSDIYDPCKKINRNNYLDIL